MVADRQFDDLHTSSEDGSDVSWQLSVSVICSCSICTPSSLCSAADCNVSSH